MGDGGCLERCSREACGQHPELDFPPEGPDPAHNLIQDVWPPEPRKNTCVLF